MITEENETKLREFILMQLKNQTFLDKLHKELLKIYKIEEAIEQLDQDDLYNVIVRKVLLKKCFQIFWQLNSKFLDVDNIFGELGEGFFLRLEIVEVSGLVIDDDMGFVRFVVNLGHNQYLGEKRKYKTPKILIKEAFYMDLNSNSLSKLTKTRDPLYLYIILEAKTSIKRKIVGIKFVEWRFVLTHNKFSLKLDVGYISSRVDQLTKNIV